MLIKPSLPPKEMHRRQHQINEKWNSLGIPIFGMGIGLPIHRTGRRRPAWLR
jgi:hypothetical protein